MSAGRVLLVGAAGLVGRHVREAFAGRPLVATRHHAAAPDAVPLDIVDAVAVRELVRETGPDTIVLAAADAYVERCEREPAATRRVNVEGTRNVADAAREVRALLIVFSSEYVFDGAAGPYAEDDPIRPVNEYGEQKAEVERIARALPRHLVCRTSGVFGWDPEGKNFVCQLLRRLRAREPFPVPSDQVITPTYAPSLADALRDLVDCGHTGTLHVAGPRVLRRDEFARLAARSFGLDPALVVPRPTAEFDFAAPRPGSAGLRTDRLRAALGHALTDSEAALADMRAIEARA